MIKHLNSTFSAFMKKIGNGEIQSTDPKDEISTLLTLFNIFNSRNKSSAGGAQDMHFDQSTFKETVDENIAANMDLPE